MGGFKIKVPKISTPKLPSILPKEISKDVGKVFGFGGISEGVQSPSTSEDPQVKALRDRLYGEAQSFERDLPGMQKGASEQIQREGDMALESGLKGTRQNFNRRGLLYSGLREAGEQGVRGKVASTMAGQKAQSNKELTDLSKSKWEKVANAGLQSYQDSVNREAEIENIKLQNSVARAQVMQQLGQVGGYAAGAYLASPSNASTPNTGTAGYSSSYNPYGNQPRISGNF